MAVALTNVFASTIWEFMNNAAAIFGAGTLGETKPAVSASWTLDENKKIASGALTLSITSKTAHWAGSGMSNGKPAPQPDPANRTAIDRVEALNQAHEQKHIDTYQTTFDANKAALEKKFVGKTAAEAGAVGDEMMGLLRAACETLHTTEGLVTVTQQGTGFAIAVSPQGPGGCT